MYLSMSKCKAADVSEEHRDVEYAEIDNEAETAGEKTTSNRRHSTARPLKPTPPPPQHDEATAKGGRTQLRKPLRGVE